MSAHQPLATTVSGALLDPTPTGPPFSIRIYEILAQRCAAHRQLALRVLLADHAEIEKLFAGVAAMATIEDRGVHAPILRCDRHAQSVESVRKRNLTGESRVRRAMIGTVEEIILVIAHGW